MSANVLDITRADIGRTLVIATKVKSRPHRGVITGVESGRDHVRVTLQGGFGTRSHLLTTANEVDFDD